MWTQLKIKRVTLSAMEKRFAKGGNNTVKIFEKNINIPTSNLVMKDIENKPAPLLGEVRGN